MVGGEVIFFPGKLDLDWTIRLLCKEGSNVVLPFDRGLDAEVGTDLMGQ